MSYSSSLLKLPPELRRHIYQYVLVVDRQPLCQMGQPDRGRLHDATALLATSREIFSEARPVFLSGNTFMICATSADLKWLQSLGPQGQRQLRKVTFFKESKGSFQADGHCINTLMRCPRLCLTLKLTVPQLIKLERMDVFKYLHEFSVVTVAKDNDINAWHNHYVRMLARTFKMQCPKNCMVHKLMGRAGHIAIVHIDCRRECQHCYA